MSRTRDISGRPGPSRGVTLLEVLVAMTIVAIVMASLFVTFRTSMRAYHEGTKTVRVLQTGRYVTDILSRDLRSIHYENYDKYNIEYRKKQMERRRLEEDRRLNGLPEAALNNENWVDPLETNPLDYMHMIDLTFKGTEDSVTFVRYQPTQGELATQPWAMARVTYEYDASRKAIVRKEEAVYDPKKRTPQEQAEWGEPVDYGLPDTSLTEVVAEHVVEFSMRFGYYGFDPETGNAGWREVKEWSSNNRRHKNPPIEHDPEDPISDRIRQFNLSVTADDLPCYVDMTIVVGATDNPARPTTLRHLVALPPAEETFTPVPPDMEVAGYLRAVPD